MDNSDARDGSRNMAAAISVGITITGDVDCATDLQIAGRVQGDVRCPTVFIDEGGAVSGGVYADRIRVSGTVDGVIEAGDLAIEAGGRVSGTITYSRLKVSAGGIVEGSFKHRAEEGNAPTGDTSNLKLVEAAAERLNPRRVYVD